MGNLSSDDRRSEGAYSASDAELVWYLEGQVDHTDTTPAVILDGSGGDGPGWLILSVHTGTGSASGRMTEAQLRGFLEQGAVWLERHTRAA